ncbi:acyl-CoA dehydrogenase family protein [Streptomyces sp. NBC_00464]|uniref:acyl-CoA dehydrogenase family protein n=1 Tax=Streptomyces sp. NBC_00464 TaxID=2975751 RepID=UPI002E17D73E
MNPLSEEAGEVASWLARVAALVPAIQEARDTVEATRHLPPALVARLRDADLYRLWVPRSLGGHEVPPRVMLRVVEEIARHDGSVAWSMMAGANSALLAARLPEAGGREVFGDPLTVVAGSLHNGGTAVRVDGGYRLTGRWRLASGCAEASWLICSASVTDEPGTGSPHIFFVPAAEAEIIHEWDAVGLRGSGSNGFRVADVFVPERLHITPGAELVVDGPLYRSSMAHFINPPLGALALGIAEDAIGCFHDLAQKKTSRGSDLTLSERGAVQEKVGTARSLVSSARAYLHAATADLWSAAVAGTDIPHELTAEIMLSTATAAKNAVEAVRIVYTAAGSSSVVESSRLARCFRDVNVVNHHDAASLQVFERVGRYALTGR